MHEHIARTLYYFQVHLLFASVVFCAAWVLTSNPRGSAGLKYWIWVATLLNFVLPLGAIIDRLWTSHLKWASPLGVIGELANNISRPGFNSAALGSVWALGAAMMLGRLCLRLRRDQREGRKIAALPAQGVRRDFVVHGVEVRFAGNRQIPAVNGVLRPQILLPDGIDELLNARELNAVLLHELTHARRRDNLIRLIQELAVCLFWFHPFVWLTGSRLALYRELSCDDPVIRSAAGRDLISALSKLAIPEREFLVQASASSLLSERLARLAARPETMPRGAVALVGAAFGAVLVSGVLETVAHTACCFVTQ